MEPSDLDLPRILCLHGGGTSAMIFNMQLRNLQRSLQHQFRFVFVNAPFESGAGPGVLPVFENCGPFYRWVKPESQTHERDQQRVRQVLREAIKSDQGDGEFVGLLGFSQGGRMTAGLLADQQNAERTGLPYWQFGILICASHPPLSMAASRLADSGVQGESDEHGVLVGDVQRDDVVRITSVHVTGTLDPHLEKGRRLRMYFDERTRTDLEFVMGHHLPGAGGDKTSDKGDTNKIRDAVLSAFGSQVPMMGSLDIVNDHELRKDQIVM